MQNIFKEYTGVVILSISRQRGFHFFFIKTSANIAGNLNETQNSACTLNYTAFKSTLRLTCIAFGNRSE